MFKPNPQGCDQAFLSPVIFRFLRRSVDGFRAGSEEGRLFSQAMWTEPKLNRDIYVIVKVSFMILRIHCLICFNYSPFLTSLL